MTRTKVRWRMRDVRSGGAAGTLGRSARRGFTLVEMVAAVAILLILLLVLVGSFTSNVVAFKKAQLMTMAENIAELQVEDLKSMAPSVLKGLVQGTYAGTETPLSPDAKNSALFRFSNYPADVDATAYGYDSGKVQTDYNIWGLTSLETASGSSYTAGPGTSSQPSVPTSAEVLLGANVEIQPYQVLDSSTGQNVGWYYRLILHKEQYPQFEKQIRVSMFSATGLPSHTVHELQVAKNGMDAMFDYTVTVYMKHDASFDVLYSVSGTISSPYANSPVLVSVLDPNGGESLTRGTNYTVRWSANGDLTDVTEYRVYLSTDNGSTWSLLGTGGAGATSLTVTLPSATSTKCKVQVLAMYSSGTVAGSDVSDNVFRIKN